MQQNEHINNTAVVGIATIRLDPVSLSRSCFVWVKGHVTETGIWSIQ